jgi:hypothetical protein
MVVSSTATQGLTWKPVVALEPYTLYSTTPSANPYTNFTNGFTGTQQRRKKYGQGF